MDPTVSTEIAKLTPVIIGGALAILGGLVTQLLAAQLNERRERIKIRREKLELLVQCLYEHLHWIYEMRSKLIYSRESYDVPSPLDKAWMLQKLYFPELQEALVEVAKTDLELGNFCREQRIGQLTDRAAWLKNYDEQPYQILFGKYLNARNIALVKAARLINKYARL